MCVGWASLMTLYNKKGSNPKVAVLTFKLSINKETVYRLTYYFITWTPPQVSTATEIIGASQSSCTVSVVERVWCELLEINVTRKI